MCSFCHMYMKGMKWEILSVKPDISDESIMEINKTKKELGIRD
ncbi:hypothetical protein HanXRQr2_Chr04g0172841 [Helianthus annuus]|uniref:Uncharacterized protein n=1 Tax=Helianthus annuus TaxID=4232 RepID=A0A9K3NSA7_HELAN|nr:hypothetical protein HanXRQr2_Chr04g0172841 [Helianthus annuus]KAJ0931835.1 hypothetical protein HanPSC8_Chr04g0166561 [Helianthus annuus]